MTRLLLILVSVVLGACTQVQSREPLFGPADTRGAPAPRTGLWTEVCKPGGEAAADCGATLAISPTRVSAHKGEAPRAETASAAGEYLLVAGSPLIVQLRRDGLQAYEYGWINSVRLDGQGRVVGFTVSAVACRLAEGSEAMWGTQGTEDDITDNIAFASTEDGACWAAGPEQVREAARLNRHGWSDTATRTFAFRGETADLAVLVARQPDPPPTPEAPAPVAEAEPPAPPKTPLGAVAAVGGGVAFIVYLVLSLFWRETWEWAAKPVAAGIIGAGAPVGVFGWAAALPHLWSVLAAVALLMAADGLITVARRKAGAREPVE